MLQITAVFVRPADLLLQVFAQLVLSRELLRQELVLLLGLGQLLHRRGGLDLNRLGDVLQLNV